jgi:myo-inositol 2-dehydrogenase/D-chiro-inositol 1-dehydrogenase
MARALADAPGATLAAIACASETTAAAAARDFPGMSVHRGYEALVARADLDAVAVVAPNHLHAEIGAAALHAGKDVLLEKPMATTRDGCDQLLAAARATGRILTVGHQLRHSAQYGRVKTLIDEGAIGTPTYATFNLFRFPFRPGSDGWRYDPARVGSWLLEETVHLFDLIPWYFEAVGAPRAVLAFGDTAARGAGLSNNVTAILRFPGEAHAVISQTLGAFEYHQMLHVVGTEGAIRSWWSGASDRAPKPSFELRLERRGHGVETVPIEQSGEIVELGVQAREVAAAFAARRAVMAGEDARRSVLACLATEQSLREGREVTLVL